MIALVGKSCSGKSTAEEILRKKYHYNKIISYTTRPIRNNEENGVDYHYISKLEFAKLENLKFFAESAENYGNFYGVAKEDCDENSVVVVDKNGLQQLKDSGIKIKSFYLYQSHIVRLKRMIKRGDSLKNILKRTLIDDIKFIGAKKACDVSLKSVDKYEVASAISVSDNLLVCMEAIFRNSMTKDITKEGDN